jgi:hypothetical protein
MRNLVFCAALAAAMTLCVTPVPVQASETRSQPVDCSDFRGAAIERLPQRRSFDIQYPKSESEELGEGWVEAFYTVSASGTVTNVEIIDMLGSKAYVTALEDALKVAKFDPAIKAGKPVDYYGYTFEVAFAIEGRNRAGVHYFGFSRAFDESKRRRNEKKFDEAVAVVKNAMTEPLNMYELATLSHGLTYAYIGLNDNHRALIAIRHAAVRGAQFLEKDAAPYALALLAKLEAKNNGPSAAICAYNQLQSKFPSFAPDDEIKQLMTAAEAQLAGSDPVRTDIELVDWGRPEIANRWTHVLLRRSFSFDITPAKPAKFRLVCGTTVREESVVSGKEWRIDPSDGTCTLLFYGDDGVKFTLIEK